MKKFLGNFTNCLTSGGGDFDKLKMNLISKEEKMEKSKKKFGLLGLLALVLIVPLALILTACCGSSLPYDVGTYVGTMRHAGGTDQPLTGSGTILVLEDDYSGYMMMTGQKSNFTFTMNDNEMIITFDVQGDTRQGTATLEDGTITLKISTNQVIETFVFEYDADYAENLSFEFGRYNATKQITIQGDNRQETPITGDDTYLTLNSDYSGVFYMGVGSQHEQIAIFTYSVDILGNLTLVYEEGGATTTGIFDGDKLTLNMAPSVEGSEMYFEFTYAN